MLSISPVRELTEEALVGNSEEERFFYRQDKFPAEPWLAHALRAPADDIRHGFPGVATSPATPVPLSGSANSPAWS